MAKAKTRKKTDRDWDAGACSEYMLGQFEAETVAGKMGIQDSGAAALADVGLPLPHLCLRYLFQRTSYPLERVTVIFGPTGSNKSSLLYWFYDLFRRHGGFYIHAEVEDKDTPLMRLAITDYDTAAGRVKPCASLNEMQKAVATWFDWFRAKCAKGPGRKIPFVVGVDSLVAKLTEEAIKKVDDNDGAPTRRYSDEARSLSDWFRYVPTHLQRWPFGLIAVNHDKPKSDAVTGHAIHHTPGGFAPNFFATYKILVEKVKQLKQTAGGWEGNRVRIRMEKNSLGPDKQSFEAEIAWKTEIGLSRSGKDTLVQRAFWNWDKATTELLFRLSEKAKDTARGKAVNEIVGISRCTGGRYASKALGVTTSDPLPSVEFARLLESRTDVLARLEPLLGIHPSTHYRPEVDFLDQLAEAAARVDDFIPAKGSTTAPAADEADPADPEADVGGEVSGGGIEA